MALVKMEKLLKQAAEKGIGCGAFNVGNMEMVRGVIRAAEELNTPVILQIAEGRLEHSPLDLMGPMMVTAARDAGVDIAVHLDHGRTEDAIRKALELGFTSVMFDGSALPLEENMERTEGIVRLAKEYDANVEGELGLVGGSEGNDEEHEIRCTDPQDVVVFCQQTGVDALAVAIGNAHGDYPSTPRLAFDVLERIASVTDVPLVLHGGSGISDSDFQRAIRCGIRKVNIATASFKALTDAAEGYLKHETRPDFFGLNTAMTEGVSRNVRRHIRIFHSA